MVFQQFGEIFYTSNVWESRCSLHFRSTSKYLAMLLGNVRLEAFLYNCHKMLSVLYSFALLCLSRTAVFLGSLALTLE